MFRKMLSMAGNILLFATNMVNAKKQLSQKEIGIVLLQPKWKNDKNLLIQLHGSDKGKRAFFIAYFEEEKEHLAHKVLKDGFIDYICIPFDSNILKAKIRVYRTLYLKDQRIGDLLTNIFPDQILNDLNSYGKYSPKRVENGVVMFTDFVDFSRKSKHLKPIEIVKKLEFYFNKFDEIIQRYKLEKIKTIGDSYMALAGVTESFDLPAVRACLAALEIREFMDNERLLARAMKREFWEIRVGIHMGPLVAGIIGTDKMSFDVWGDTVNLASRAEQISWPGQITITAKVAEAISPYFDLENRGEIEITKRGGREQMFFLQFIKDDFCLYGEGIHPSTELRISCGLIAVDFISMRKEILNRLKTSLPEDLIYHDIEHTIGVEKAAIRLARLEGLDEEATLLLRTAALYHDAGFIFQYEDNEQYGIKMAQSSLPKFGFNKKQIEIVSEIIQSTRLKVEPTTTLEKLMSDADHDYFGRADYYMIADGLKLELEAQGMEFTEASWIDYQLAYLENKHRYFSDSSINIRMRGKNRRIQELKKKKIQLESPE